LESIQTFLNFHYLHVLPLVVIASETNEIKSNSVDPSNCKL
jgi:hypothetical protein